MSGNSTTAATASIDGLLTGHTGTADLPTLEQPDRNLSRENGKGRIVVPVRGDYAELAAVEAGLEPGTTPLDGAAGYVLATTNLTRENGGIGLLRLTFTKSAAEDSTSDDADELDVDWELTTQAQTLSILRYCGRSASQGYRPRIETWMREPDGELKSSYKYHAEGGEIVDLQTAGDKLMADKILAGIESVMRHFPSIRKTTTYTKGKFEPSGDLDYYCTKAEMKGYGCPETLADRKPKWLKTREDVKIARDKTQTLIEEWIGGDSFDENLYGPDNVRWTPASI